MDDYGNQAEHNRQLLRRYTPEQCILQELTNHAFAALQAGKPITWWNYGSFSSLFLLGAFILAFLCTVILVMLTPAFNAGAEDLTSPVFIVLLVLLMVQMLAMVGFMITIKFKTILPRVRELNALWQHGKLLVSRHVEIVAAQDGDARYSLHYVFETPGGLIVGETNRDLLSDQAIAKPTMLMLYRSPQEYLIL